jgi:hypothetical protein
MKKILFILLICPLFSLAQTKPQPDTIKIPTHAARQIAKDLVSCDSLKAIHNLTAQQLTLTEQKVAVQDKIISSHIEKGIMYEQRIKNEQEKYTVQGKWLEDLKKENKKLKVKVRFIQVAGVAVGGVLTYLYISFYNMSS